MTTKERKEYDQWLSEMEATVRAEPELNEAPEVKAKRIAELLKSPMKFCKYYFSEYIDADFGWFHKRAAKELLANKSLFMALEWPREHAKSIFVDVMMTLYLKARGELTGVILASANQDKAAGLLADIQGELMFNKKFVSDFGDQYREGKWTDGEFSTLDGVGFWAFGRGQSPRGVRERQNRPNLGIIDDIDDAEIVKNEKRVADAVDWVFGDFYGCLAIKDSRLIAVSNRTHRNSIFANIVGDIDENTPKRDNLIHIKVYALENPKTHAMDMSENGVPAWKERYTRDQLFKKMGAMGRRLALREYFHQHIIIGRYFNEEDLPWVKLPDIRQCKKLVTYCDPSWKDSKKNDFKAILLVGQNGPYFDIYKAFCRQCSTPEMVRGHYALADEVPDNVTCPHWMEANFIQDIHLKTYDEEAVRQGYAIGIRGDKRKKPEKTERIEGLTAYTERRMIRFNVAEKYNPDMIELRNQFLGFPDTHDDGPDACEGAIYKLNKPGFTKRSTPNVKYERSADRKRRVF